MNGRYPLLLGAAILPNLLAAGTAAGQAADKPADTLQTEKKYTLKIETAQHKRHCRAKVSLEFTQRNTIADTKFRIENEDCGASGGELIIAVRVRDEDGEVRTTEHEEAWQREADQAITFQRNYVIGKSVDLVRVRARKVVCICAETPNDIRNSQRGKDNE